MVMPADNDTLRICNPDQWALPSGPIELTVIWACEDAPDYVVLVLASCTSTFAELEENKENEVEMDWKFEENRENGERGV